MTTAAGRRLTVGAVVAALSEEFPDVTISKVRFLEAEGLVTPARTASGYRQFTPDDVERLRYVLRAQRDRFWPLKVIKDNLDAIDRGLTPGDAGDGRAPAARRRRPTPTCRMPPTLAARRALRLTAAELARATGLAPAEVADLVSLRPAAPRRRRAARRRRPAGGPRRGRPGRPTGSSRATCGASAPPPTARWGWSSRWSARGAVPTPQRHAAEVAHLCLALHAALVRGGLSGRGG